MDHDGPSDEEASLPPAAGVGVGARTPADTTNAPTTRTTTSTYSQPLDNSAPGIGGKYESFPVPASQSFDENEDFALASGSPIMAVGGRSTMTNVGTGGGTTTGIAETTTTTMTTTTSANVDSSNNNDKSSKTSTTFTSNTLTKHPTTKKSRGKVLVHYHPQLGDEGYESTLLSSSSAAASGKSVPPHSSKSNSHPAATAAATYTHGGIHSRMIDDVRSNREINEMNSSNVDYTNSGHGNGYNHNSTNSSNSSDQGENDEYNNAATRQIRRRVFRAAMDRGRSLEARRRQLLNADEDVGGPPPGGGRGNSKFLWARDGEYDRQQQQQPQQQQQQRSGLGQDQSSRQEQSKQTQQRQQTLSINTRLGNDANDNYHTPRSSSMLPTEFSSHHATNFANSNRSKSEKKNMQIQSPPSPPRHPPSYRLIVQSLIAEHEPEKLSHIDRVMEKYKGREEELIKKLDLRYRKRKNNNANAVTISTTINTPTRHSNQKNEEENESEMRDPKRTPSRTAVVSMHKSRDDVEEKTLAKNDNNVTNANHAAAATASSATDQPKPAQPTTKNSITDSTKTAVTSNLLLMEENRVQTKITGKSGGEVVWIPVGNAGEERKKTTIIGNYYPTTPKREGVREKDNTNLGTPSYDDGVSIITMETKETLTLKSQKGEVEYSFGNMLRRPPDSIILDNNATGNVGAGASDNNDSNAVKSPLTPNNNALSPSKDFRRTNPPKINRMFPGYGIMETEEEKTRAIEDSLVAAAKLDDVEARIRARQKVVEEDAEGRIETKAEGTSSGEKDGDKSSVLRSGRNLDPSLDEEEVVSKAAIISKEKELVEAEIQAVQNDIARLELETAVEVDAVKNEELQTEQAELSSNSAIPALIDEPSKQKTEVVENQLAEDVEAKIARLVAEKEAEALQKAQEAIERERKARIEAEAARIKAEQEVERLKAKVESREEKKESEEEHELHRASDAESESEVNPTNENEIPAIATKFSIAESSISSKRSVSPVDDIKAFRSLENQSDSSVSANGDLGNQLPESDEDTVEKFRAVWSSDDEDSLPAGTYEDDEGDDDDVENKIVRSSSEQLDDLDTDGDNADVVEDSQEEDRSEALTQQDDAVAVAKAEVVAMEPLDFTENARADKNEHDFPSTTMQHTPVTLTTTKPEEPKNATTPLQNTEDEEAEANIHHVAKVTFEGNPRKGQLSFITGAVVLAHSNQRGPWWLGRSGGRTGWFPASAVVPASEFLGNNAVESPGIEDEEKEFAQVSNTDLDEVYDLIRSPSDPGDSDEENHVDEDVNSPAKNRWMDDGYSRKESASSSRDISPPASPRLDPSESVGLKERLFETKISDESQNVIPNETASNAAMVPAQHNQIPVAESTPASSQNDKQPTTQETPANNKPKRLWRTAIDKGTGLTYYYHIETRETTWEKPTGFSERKTPTNKGAITGTSKTIDTTEAKAVYNVPNSTTPTSVLSGESKEASHQTKKHHGGKGILRFLKKKKVKAEKIANKDKSPREANGDKAGGVVSPLGTKDAGEKFAELKQDPANQAHFNYSDDDDSYSSSSDDSDQTESSIFSTRRIRETVGKMTDKITGLTFRHNTSSYETLDDEDKAKESSRSSQSDEKRPDATDNTRPKTEETTAAAKTSETKAGGEAQSSAADSGWRSAIDPKSQRTYYYNKLTKEVVWAKPPNF